MVTPSSFLVCLKVPKNERCYHRERIHIEEQSRALSVVLHTPPPQPPTDSWMSSNSYVSDPYLLPLR